MFERRLRSCWWRLRVEDASSVAQALMLTNQHSHETLSLLAMWVAINLHEVRGDTMTQFLALFSQFRCVRVASREPIHCVSQMMCLALRLLSGRATTYVAALLCFSPHVVPGRSAIQTKTKDKISESF